MISRYARDTAAEVTRKEAASASGIGLPTTISDL